MITLRQILTLFDICGCLIIIAQYTDECKPFLLRRIFAKHKKSA